MATSLDGLQLSIAAVKVPDQISCDGPFKHSQTNSTGAELPFCHPGYTSSCTLSGALGAARLVHSHLQL